MLTSVYYYQAYRPYLLRQVQRAGAASVTTTPRKPPITQRPSIDPDAMFVLNKTMRGEILNHARGTSRAINRTKDGARNVLREMQGFNQNALEYSTEYARERVAGRLQYFADGHNEVMDFMMHQEHSEDLLYFAEELAELFSGGRYELSQVDMRTSEDGRGITFSPDEFHQKDIEELNRAFSRSIGIFNHAYRQASKMLQTPLVSHMDFRELSYHYNYKLGMVVADAFGLMGSGMIINTRL